MSEDTLVVPTIIGYGTTRFFFSDEQVELLSERGLGIRSEFFWLADYVRSGVLGLVPESKLGATNIALNSTFQTGSLQPAPTGSLRPWYMCFAWRLGAEELARGTHLLRFTVGPNGLACVLPDDQETLAVSRFVM